MTESEPFDLTPYVVPGTVRIDLQWRQDRSRPVTGPATPSNGCCSPCAEHSNPPGACLDCGHCHPCHLKRDFPPGAVVLGEHPVPIKIGIRDAQVFYVEGT